MSAQAAEGRLQFDIARAEIDSWRGQCLDIFARAERAIGETLERAAANGRSVELKHLAGQRLAELGILAKSEVATERQREALERAISNWHAYDEKRAFLAHGVVDEAIDRQGQWWVTLYLRHYNKGTAVSERWTLSKVEAGDFQTLLAKAFGALSGQLGQFRTRLSR